MGDIAAPAAITAIVYRAGQRVDVLMQDMATRLGARGIAIAGFIQIDRERAGRSRCDMILHDLATRTTLEISEDRGPMARGCMLDIDQLSRATALTTAALEAGAEILIVNKFGKTEALGGGFRPLIADAVAKGIPVVVAVPASNLDSWRQFADGLAREVDADACAISLVASLSAFLGAPAAAVDACPTSAPVTPVTVAAATNTNREETIHGR